MDVFNLNGGLINQNPHGKGKTTQRHQIHRLTSQPQPNDCGENCQRNIQHHYQGTTPVSEEQQNHQPGQNCPKDSLRRKASNGTRDIRRLIKFEGHLNVIRKLFLHPGQCVANLIDDIHCRSVCTLRCQDIDRSTPIHKCIPGRQVRRVFDCTDITHVDCLLSRPERDLSEFFDVTNHRVRWHCRKTISEVNIARGTNRVSCGQRGNDIIRR